MKVILKMCLLFCISIMTSCSSNNLKTETINPKTETMHVESVNSQNDLKITFKNETTFVFKVYKFDLETKQWELLLITNPNISWEEDSYIHLFNPINDDGLCFEIDNKNGISEKYGYHNNYYDSIISNEKNFVWLFNENSELIDSKEIPIAYGIFLNDDNKMLLDFDASLMENTSQIENNMVMFTIMGK